ncbi:MAG: efflux RND transporter periplasmic adaptor subunit, partial [Candidatus Saccharicenans sp.]
PEQLMLAIPEEAVQEINGQQVVFIPESEGVFIPRRLRTGPPIKGWLPVLSGLTAGEKYVARGAFMLKSELLKHTLGEEEHDHD